MRFQQDKEARLSEELERDRNQLNHVFYNIKRLAEEKAQEDETLQTVKELVQNLKQAVDDLTASQNSARAELNELNSINNSLQIRYIKPKRTSIY